MDHRVDHSGVIAGGIALGVSAKEKRRGDSGGWVLARISIIPQPSGAIVIFCTNCATDLVVGNRNAARHGNAGVGTRGRGGFHDDIGARGAEFPAHGIGDLAALCRENIGYRRVGTGPS